MSDEIACLINDPPTIRRGDFITCAFCRATLGGWLAGSMGHPPAKECDCRGARVLTLAREQQSRIAELTEWRPMETAPRDGTRIQVLFRHILGWLPLLPGVGAESATAPEVSLDEKGRCCGRKPLHYKRPSPHYFCCRCDRQYGPDGQWRPNWAWVGPHERSESGENSARALARQRSAVEVPK